MSDAPLEPVVEAKRIWWKPRLNLAGAISIAIFVAFCIVAVAYTMYWNDSNRKYDIARGGEKANQALAVEDEEADTTSPVTPAAAQNKIEYLTKELNALNSLNKFNADDLSDQSIQLVPSDEPSL
mgnify:CR=1 FL=1